MTASAPVTTQKTAKASPRGTVLNATTTLATSTTDATRDLLRRIAAGMAGNPMSILVGGVALGILAGAFVPRSERETQLLGPVGKRLTDSAKGAIDAAKDTARSELDVLGLTRHAARGQASKLLEGMLAAVAASGAAALAASRKAETAAKTTG